MNNLEMLKIAAKAAGSPVGTSRTGGGLLMANDLYWNPLTDSGQALELAVRVPIVAVLDEVWVTQRTSIAEWERDPIAATRLAIVRAVVEEWQDVTLEEKE